MKCQAVFKYNVIIVDPVSINIKILPVPDISVSDQYFVNSNVKLTSTPDITLKEQL